ncbi:MAG: hypothetical protein M0Z36_00790 [Thermaerobacter sp.]|nr:hypothetical protein [Thermaerobacter sp.]
MIKTIAVGLGLLMLTGLAAQSGTLAWKLWRLNHSLSQNLQGANQLVAVEHDMQAKNRALSDMLTVTRGLGASLDVLNRHAAAITTEVATLQRINQQTNAREAGIVTASAAAGLAAAHVNTHVLSLIQSGQDLKASLLSLAAVSQAEVQVMRTLMSNARLIEAKTP